jgi:hypothetical protein
MDMTLEVLEHIKSYPKIKGMKILDTDYDEYLEAWNNFLHRRALNMTINMLDVGKNYSSNSDLDALALSYLFNDKPFSTLVDKTRKIVNDNIKNFSISS